MSSAGGTYPLEIYIVIGNNKVKNLEAGIYHYDPFKNSLARISNKDVRLSLTLVSLGQVWLRLAPATVVISAIFERAYKRYSQRSMRYTDMEAGHASQNIYLQAVSLGLGTVAIGAFSDSKVKQVLGIKSIPLYLMPIGFPK